MMREILTGVIIGVLFSTGYLIWEFGKYAEEINPFNRHDTGSDFEDGDQ